MRWTEDEVFILKNNYGNVGIVELALLLPGKSKNAIFKMAALRKLNNPDTSPRLKWEDHELSIIKENYGKLSYREMQSLLPNRTMAAIAVTAQHFGIAKKIIDYKLNICNNGAYFMGWIASDGNLYHGKTGYTVSLSVHTSDAAILHELCTFLGIGKVFRGIRTKLDREGNPYISDMSTLKIHNKGLFEHLKELGIPEKKSKIITFPSFYNEALYKNFIRGVFDGDGSVFWKTSFNKHGKDNGFWQSCIVSASKIFLDEIKNYLTINNIIKNGKVHTKPTVYSLIINREDTVTFAKWLYDDDSMKLERKYNKMQKALNGIREPKNVK